MSRELKPNQEHQLQKLQGVGTNLGAAVARYEGMLTNQEHLGAALERDLVATDELAAALAKAMGETEPPPEGSLHEVVARAVEFISRRA